MSARLGEDHWRAKLTDHDVELIRLLLLERRMLIVLRQAEGCRAGRVEAALRSAELSYAGIARKFEVSKSHVRWLALGDRRAITTPPHVRGLCLRAARTHDNRNHNPGVANSSLAA